MHGDWSPDRAEALARGAGVPRLGDRHWKVIASTREEAAIRGRVPGLGRIQELTGFGRGELLRLFPGDAEALITRIAGCERPADAGREVSAGAPQEE